MTGIPCGRRFVRAASLLAVPLLGACGVAALYSAPAYTPPNRQEVEAKVAAEMEARQRRNGRVAPRQQITSDGVQVVFQTGHGYGIQHVAMSDDGRHIVSADYAIVKLWDVASRKEERAFTLDMGGIDPGFSSDGTRLFLTRLNETVAYDVASGREVARASLISADGRIGVRQDLFRQQGLAIVDFGTGAEFRLAGELGTPLAVSANGTMLLVRSWRIGRFPVAVAQKFVVWDLETRQARLSLPADATTSEPRLSGDGRRLVLENDDGSVDVYELGTKQKRHVALPGAAQKLAPRTSPLMDAQARELVRANGDGSFAVYDLDSGTRVLALPADTRPNPGGLPPGFNDAASFSNDGKLLAVRDGQNVRVVEIESGRIVDQLEASGVAFSPDRQSIIYGRPAGGTPIVRELATAHEWSLGSTVGTVAGLAVTADGRFAVASGSGGGGARVWDLATGQIVRDVQCPGGTQIYAISASPRAAEFAGGCVDGSAWLWESGSDRPVNLAPPRSGGMGPGPVVRFSTDGARIVIGSGGQLIAVDAATRQVVARLTLPAAMLPYYLEHPGLDLSYLDADTLKQMPKKAREELATAQRAAEHQDPRVVQLTRDSAQVITALAVHPNGRWVAVGRSYDFALWDIDSGQRVRLLSGSTESGPPPAGSNAAAAGAGGLLSALKGGGKQPAAESAAAQQAALEAQFERLQPGARSVAFTPDGRQLYADGRFWDLATGHIVATAPRVASEADADGIVGRLSAEIATVVALSPDGRLAARAIGQVVRVMDVASGADIAELVGHTGLVQSMAFAPDGRTLVSGGVDGAVRVWTLPAGQQLAALFALGPTDSVAVTPDQYYRASKSRLTGVSFRVRDQLYPFEQFDLRFNRPDIVLERLGRASAEEIQSYRAVHERRLRKMGFSESMLTGDFHVPDVEIAAAPPVSTDARTLTLHVRSSDDRYPLDRLNAFVNDVPVFGTAGIGVPDRQAQRDERDVTVPLVPGTNKIQVSVLNQQGAESLKRTVYTTSTADAAAGDVYVVAVGVSHYLNPRYNLRFAAKDATDLIGAYRGIEARAGSHSQVHVLDLTNEKATRAGIRAARAWLEQSHPNDLVVVFAAGHGMTDARDDYYFGTYDIDPQNPQTNGLPYEEFEALLDGIPALKKMLLIDTCFSGEVDKDTPTLVAGADAGTDGTVQMRTFKAPRGVFVTPDTPPAASLAGASAGSTAASDVLHFQDMFADLRRGTGAVVISSASGNEFALEGEQWNNGVFTYALLSGLRDGKADANHDGTVTVGELQAYVIEAVRKLTAGGQNPTVRRENLDFDFAVY